MDRFLAVTVAALALAAPLYCRHAPSLSALSTDVSTSQPPLEHITLSVIPLQPEDWPATSRKPHAKHLYSDEGKLWTKFPNSKHLVEIVPLRRKTKLKKGKALAYILPKSKNRKQLGFGTIQDLNDIVFDSDESSNSFYHSGSSELDSSSSEYNGSDDAYTKNPDIQSIVDSTRKQTGFNSENIINSKLNDIVAFLKDNSDSGDLTYETVDGDRPDYHVHYITHRNHRSKMNQNDNIPSHIQEKLHNVLKDKDGHHMKLKQIQHLVPGESPVPIAVPIGINSDFLVPSGIHGHNDILIPGKVHGNSDFIVPKISDLIIPSNSLETNTLIDPGNIHGISDFIVPESSDLILPTVTNGINSNVIVPSNIHGNSNLIPHAVPVSIRYSNEDPEAHHIGILKYTDQGLTHPSHRVIDDFNPFDIVNNHYSTHTTQDTNENHLKGKEISPGHILSSTSHNTQAHDVTHDLDLEVGEILDMLSEADLAEQHSYAPIKASDETNSFVDPVGQSASNEDSNSESSDSSSLNSDSDSIDSLPESNDVQLQVESADNSNSVESASDSSSYSDEASAAVANNSEDNVEIHSNLKLDVSGDSIEGSSSSEESLGDVNGADITVGGLEKHLLLPDCLRIKKKTKKNCNGHKSYQLTFLFNR